MWLHSLRLGAISFCQAGKMVDLISYLFAYSVIMKADVSLDFCFDMIDVWPCGIMVSIVIFIGCTPIVSSGDPQTDDMSTFSGRHRRFSTSWKACFLWKRKWYGLAVSINLVFSRDLEFLLVVFVENPEGWTNYWDGRTEDLQQAWHYGDYPPILASMSPSFSLHCRWYTEANESFECKSERSRCKNNP